MNNLYYIIAISMLIIINIIIIVRYIIFNKKHVKYGNNISDILEKIDIDKSYSLEEENNNFFLNEINLLIVQLMKSQAGIIFIYNEDDNKFEIGSNLGYKITNFKKSFKFENIFKLLDKKNVIIVNSKIIEEKCFVKENSIIAKINFKQKILGLLIIHRKSHKYTKYDIKKLILILNSLAAQIKIYTLYNKQNKHAIEIKKLFLATEKLSQFTTLKEILKNFTEIALDLTNSSACSLRLLNNQTNELEIKATANLSMDYKHKKVLKLGEGVGGKVALENKPIVIYNIRKDTRVKYTQYLKNENLVSLLSVPIRYQGLVIGIISVYMRHYHKYSQDDINTLSTFASHVSNVITKVQLYEKLETNYYEFIDTLINLIEAKDKYTKGHSERVTNYSKLIGKKMNLDDEDLKNLEISSRLHDIGKIGIPDNILNKTGKLNFREYEKIKSHPVIGYEIIKKVNFLSECAQIIKHHHEKFDGTGYPDNLSKEQIPLLSRIITVTDTFDAMITNRPYKEPLSVKQAISELINNKRTQFDPEIVDIFVEIINCNINEKYLVK